MSRPLNAPVVSVMMPVHNAMPYLVESIESILRQTFANIELIAIDDGSTDSSLQVLREASHRDPRVRVTSRANQGVVATRNECLSLAQAELVAVNDADDVSAPTRLAKQVAYLEANPDCLAVGTRMCFVDPHGLSLGDRFKLTEHAAIDGWHMSGRGAAIGHSSVMMRASNVRQIGGYRDGYAPSEDYDMWLRLAEHGQLSNLNETLAQYRLHPASLSHEQTERQHASAWQAVSDARVRRGMPALIPQEAQYQPTPAEVSWMRDALANRSFHEGRKLAIKALRTHPFSRLSWRLAVMGLLGPKLPAAIRLLRKSKQIRL